MMKNKAFLAVSLAIVTAVMVSCTKSDPAASGQVTLSFAATTATGSGVISGRVAATTVTLTDVKVNIREIEFEYDHDDDRFKSDSSFSFDDNSELEAKLKGPFIVDLMNAGDFVDQTVATITVPNARFEKVKFKLSPSKVDGDMKNKTMLINGSIGDTPFVFWHDAEARFGAKFTDSTSLSIEGQAAKLAIQFEMDRIFSKLNGGVDLSTATDGNNDGTITIDPDNTDGNAELAHDIMTLLSRHTHCKKHKD